MICEYSDFCSWITSFQRMRMPTNASLPMLMLTAHMSFHWQWLKVCMNLVGVYDNVYTLCVAGQLIFSPGPCGIFSYKAYFSPCVREASVSGHLSTLTLMLSRSSCMDTFIFCELVKKNVVKSSANTSTGDLVQVLYHPDLDKFNVLLSLSQKTAIFRSPSVDWIS